MKKNNEPNLTKEVDKKSREEEFNYPPIDYLNFLPGRYFYPPWGYFYPLSSYFFRKHHPFNKQKDMQ
ncbi:hypothetical protein FZD47_20600 [Bacillus infantis]|uniref:Uncharacterized protein n=1 Tax=Bacillus infantis TaxID=324767 RepID=A0A5D4SBF3_9BACI|nr:hypothetical protein [Bacillus infantis]TYS60610.1 hypothetical protein FZD47_20600 [Bacillus infantis]